MKNFGLRIGVLVAWLLVFGVECGWAEDATSSGAVSKALSQNLYCSTQNLLEGNLGLLLGLILVFMGLWGLVQGGKIMAALPIIIIGALVTALPSLIQSGFEGLGSMLQASKISSHGFDAPDCTKSGMTGTDNHPGKVEDDRVDAKAPGGGSFFPGVYHR